MKFASFFLPANDRTAWQRTDINAWGNDQIMRSRLRDAGISFGLVAITTVAFASLWSGDHDFVNFDDYEYVKDNLEVQRGVSTESLWWALTTFHGHNWVPLTWISFQLDHAFHGLDTRGFHATNLVLHTANVVLLYLFLRWSTGAVWAPAVAAAFFALHPLRVESVAWVTERKDVLSTFFWMLTLLAYLWYAELPSVGRYGLLFLGFTLGLLSKPMVVTLPCVLLLLDYWPLRRWRGASDKSPSSEHAEVMPQGEPRFRSASLWRLIFEKVPLFLLAVVGCMIALRSGAALIDAANQHVSLGPRLWNALISYVNYLRQLFWPNDLAVLYLHPGDDVSMAQGVAAGLLLAAISMLALYGRRRCPYFLVGWLWYLGTLVPVIGLIQVARQARADRFTYVPLIGVFIMLSWGGAAWIGQRRFGRAAVAAGTAALLIACAAVTRSQLQHWRNSASLWDRAVQVSGDDPRMHAIAARSFLRSREIDRAIHHAEMTRKLDPDNADSHRLLAMVLELDGKYDEAVLSMARAVALAPNSADIRGHMAQFLLAQGRIPAAYEQYAVLARLKSDSAEGQNYHGIMAHRSGNLMDAVRCFREAVRLMPGNALYRCDLALALEDQGEIQAAGMEYQAALDLKPQVPFECASLAMILATHPDAERRSGNEAIRRARQACSFAPKHPLFLGALAAAYAEGGRFELAIATADEARRIAIADNVMPLVDQLDEALQLFRKRQPFRARIQK